MAEELSDIELDGVEGLRANHVPDPARRHHHIAVLVVAMGRQGPVLGVQDPIMCNAMKVQDALFLDEIDAAVALDKISQTH